MPMKIAPQFFISKCDGAMAKSQRFGKQHSFLVGAGPGFTLADQTTHDTTFQLKLVYGGQFNETGVGLAVFGVVNLALPLVGFGRGFHRLDDPCTEQGLFT